MSELRQIWPKKISVDKRIVRILSGSTYENFPKALKEIIINSYDADANKVRISFDINKETIFIEDDGFGMNEDDLDFYLRIAGKSREKESKTRGNRIRVGQFGVGFLSLFPFCKTYTLESTKMGMSDVIKASIPCEDYFSPSSGLRDVDEIPISGGTYQNTSLINRQFTKVSLIGFSQLTDAFINEDYKIQRRRKTILNMNAVDRLKWELSEDLPIEYPRDYKDFNRIYHDFSGLKFEVYLNEEKLFRNVHASNILEEELSNTMTVGKIKFKFYIAANKSPIDPVEGRYLKIRNLNVGVGSRTSLGIGLEGRVYGKLMYLSAEVNVLEGLNDLITVSREGFNYSPDYERFKDYFIEKIRYWANRLDDVAEMRKIRKDISDETKINDLKTLDQKNIDKKIEKLAKSGIILKSTEKNDNVYNEEDSKKDSNVFKYSKSEIIEKEFTASNKRLLINGKIYFLDLESWDFENSDFPACFVNEKNILKVNDNYPLFSEKKYLDIFLKFHVILMEMINNNTLDLNTYHKINKTLLETFI